MWVAWGFNPADFWRTHPAEWWWIYDLKEEQARNTPQKKYAGMSEAQVAAIYEDAYG